ncbi:unnamed protein product, partial [marine sediment metagenome]
DKEWKEVKVDSEGKIVIPVISTGGWYSAKETWTYDSADDPTFTFKITGDKTGKYSV